MPAVLINPPAARLGSACAIVHGNTRRYEMRGVRAPLSLKTVVRGSAEWVTEGGRFELTPGMLLVVNDGEEYSIAVDALQPVETFCVFFKSGFVEDAWHAATRSSAALLEDDWRPPVVIRERLQFGGALLQGMTAAHARAGRDAALDASMYELASLVVRASCDIDARAASLPVLRSSTRHELTRRLGMAMERMHTALDRPLTIPEMAREACLSPFHFHRLFTAFTGETPHRYLRRLRLERARAMLRGGRRSVVEVAQSCGFESPTSFSAAFARHFGAPPRSFVNSQE
jgi:AraC-like DNA-binding protein